MLRKCNTNQLTNRKRRKLFSKTKIFSKFVLRMCAYVYRNKRHSLYDCLILLFYSMLKLSNKFEIHWKIFYWLCIKKVFCTEFWNWWWLQPISKWMSKFNNTFVRFDQKWGLLIIEIFQTKENASICSFGRDLHKDKLSY